MKEPTTPNMIYKNERIVLSFFCASFVNLLTIVPPNVIIISEIVLKNKKG